MALTVDQAKAYILKQIKDFRAPDKKGFKTVQNWGEQQKREYEDAKSDAARTGNQSDIDRAIRLKEIVALYDSVVKSRNLTTKAQSLYENIDSNRKKLDSLKALGEGETKEAQKIQRQLTRARTELQTVESDRDAFGKVPKKDQSKAQEIVAEKPKVVAEEKVTPTPDKIVTDGKDTTKDKVIPEATDEEQRISALDVAATDFSLPETIFKNVPSLNRILKQYVDENWTEAKLRKAIRDDNWYRKNSAEIKTRYVQKFNYDDLVATGQADGSTDYEMQISKIERQLAKRAAEIGSSAANDPASLRKAAENLYITNRSEDTTYIDDFLAASIKTVAGMIGGKVTEGYSGEALTNYNKLVDAARNNGFKVSDIIPGGANEAQVLQGIASGKIDINRVVADARKLAAQGQPQYVRDLLAQGYNLDQVFKPYRQTMATILDIGDPEQIDLNDPLLRSAITDKGDMNLYDFKKALRQDNRWQYTTQARQDVSTAALGVLRDFGFQG
jgi:hypothetical protein